MFDLNKNDIASEAQLLGWLCLNLYLHSKSASQWQTHYESVTGIWEWYFFNERGGLDG
mgnify:CR=1 FL=1